MLSFLRILTYVLVSQVIKVNAVYADDYLPVILAQKEPSASPSEDKIGGYTMEEWNAYGTELFRYQFRQKILVTSCAMKGEMIEAQRAGEKIGASAATWIAILSGEKIDPPSSDEIMKRIGPQIEAHYACIAEAMNEVHEKFARIINHAQTCSRLRDALFDYQTWWRKDMLVALRLEDGSSIQRRADSFNKTADDKFHKIRVYKLCW